MSACKSLSQWLSKPLKVKACRWCQLLGSPQWIRLFLCKQGVQPWESLTDHLLVYPTPPSVCKVVLPSTTVLYLPVCCLLFHLITYLCVAACLSIKLYSSSSGHCNMLTCPFLCNSCFSFSYCLLFQLAAHLGLHGVHVVDDVQAALGHDADIATFNDAPTATQGIQSCATWSHALVSHDNFIEMNDLEWWLPPSSSVRLWLVSVWATSEFDVQRTNQYTAIIMRTTSLLFCLFPLF